MFRRLFALCGYVHESEVTKAVKRTNEYVATARAADFKADVATATELLSGDYEFRTLRAIRRALGLAKSDCRYVRAVLHAAGARPDYHNKNRYGLKSRVGASGRRSRY